MTFAVTTFADGQLPSSAGTLWTVPAATSDYVKSVSFSNVSAGSVDMTLWVRIGANDRQILKATLAAGETIYASDILLPTGESLKAVASAGAAIDYVAKGVRET